MSDTVARRRDFARIRMASNEARTAERLAAHFQLESHLARQLRDSSKSERTRLYSSLYNELFDGVADHPQHNPNRDVRNQRIARQAEFLLGRLDAISCYVELGCGDAALTKRIAPDVGAAIGVDVTDALIGVGPHPPGFRFLKTEGTNLDLPDASVDLVYSNQLMEHLHPDDADDQLREIVRILKSGGKYICTTPNRLTGPHDISRYFSYQPLGFHLREYDHGALDRIFRDAGFRSVSPIVFLKGRVLAPPMGAVKVAEGMMSLLPDAVRARLSASRFVTNLAGVTVCGVK
jgi:SAM-dependent methyltransferase